MKYKGIEDTEWVGGLRRLAEDEQMPDEVIERAMIGFGVTWPKTILEEMIDTLKSVRPELAQSIIAKASI
jgi:hypothetical protein